MKNFKWVLSHSFYVGMSGAKGYEFELLQSEIEVYILAIWSVLPFFSN